MFSSALSSVPSSVSVRSQSGNGGGLIDISANPSQRRKPTREMSLPVSIKTNETESGGVSVSQPIAAVASRLGMFGWFGSSTSLHSLNGERLVDEPKPSQVEKPKAQVEEPRAEEVAVEPRSSDREEALVERERQVESREMVVEERELVVAQKEKDLQGRSQALVERERVGKEGEEAMEKKVEEVERREKELEERLRQVVDKERVGKEGEEDMQRKVEEIERRERELEDRRAEFETERAKWDEERQNVPKPEWKDAMEGLREEMSLEISAERKKTEERERALEARVMKKMNEIVGSDDKSSIKARKMWGVAVKPLIKKGGSTDSA